MHLAPISSSQIQLPSDPSAWLSAHVTPFHPHVRITSISVGNDVTDVILVKLVLPSIISINEKLMELGINDIKVTTTLSLMNIVPVVKPLLNERNSGVFVNVNPRDVPMSSSGLFEVGGYEFIHRPDTHVRYDNLYCGLMLDYGVIETSVLKAADRKVFEDVMVKIDGRLYST